MKEPNITRKNFKNYKNNALINLKPVKRGSVVFRNPVPKPKLEPLTQYEKPSGENNSQNTSLSPHALKQPNETESIQSGFLKMFNHKKMFDFLNKKQPKNEIATKKEPNLMNKHKTMPKLNPGKLKLENVPVLSTKVGAQLVVEETEPQTETAINHTGCLTRKGFNILSKSSFCQKISEMILCIETNILCAFHNNHTYPNFFKD